MYTFKHIQNANQADLRKGLYLVILHAGRVPPHIGMLAGGFYHSLSVKGQDLDVPLEALLKNGSMRKIPSLFIRVHPHLVYDDQALSVYFKEEVKKYKRVDIGVATCLSPLKTFFASLWPVETRDVNFLYELLPVLEQNKLLGMASCMNMEELVKKGQFTLPFYTLDQINKGIETVRNEFN